AARAGAGAAAPAAARAWAADPARRPELLGRLAGELDRLAPRLVALQAAESGLAAADARTAVSGAAGLARALAATAPRAGRPAGVTGHVLSWGLPLLEIASAVLPPLAAGHTAVVKPSLRAPLSAVAVGDRSARARVPTGE